MAWRRASSHPIVKGASVRRCHWPARPGSGRARAAAESISFVDFPKLSFDFDRVCCTSFTPILVRNWCGARFGRGAVASGRFWLITYAKSLVDVIAKWGNQVRLEWSKLVRPALPVGAEKDPVVPNDIDVHSRSRQGKIESNIIANIRCELTRDCTARSTQVTSLGLCNTTVEGARIYGQPFRCSFVSMRAGKRADPLDGTEVSRGAASFKIGTTAIVVRM